MELAGIIAGVLPAVGGLVVLTGAGLHTWAAGHQDLAGKRRARPLACLGGRRARTGAAGRRVWELAAMCWR